MCSVYIHVRHSYVTYSLLFTCMGNEKVPLSLQLSPLIRTIKIVFQEMLQLKPVMYEKLCLEANFL